MGTPLATAHRNLTVLRTLSVTRQFMSVTPLAMLPPKQANTLSPASSTTPVNSTWESDRRTVLFRSLKLRSKATRSLLNRFLVICHPMEVQNVGNWGIETNLIHSCILTNMTTCLQRHIKPYRPCWQLVIGHWLPGKQRRSEGSLPQARSPQEPVASGIHCWLESGAGREKGEGRMRNEERRTKTEQDKAKGEWWGEKE